MSENNKKMGLVAVIILAVAAAGYSAYKYSTADRMIIENTTPMPPGYKSEKARALEAQRAGQVAEPKGEKDLGSVGTQ